MLEVLHPGQATYWIDPPRKTGRRLGLARGGPAHRLVAALANALVGNPANAPILEITLVGPTLRALDSVVAVQMGGHFRLWRDQQPLEPGKTFSLSAGQELRIGGTTEGCRGYLAITALNRLEASHDLPRDGLPGKIDQGDRLLTGEQILTTTGRSLAILPPEVASSTGQELRILLGPQHPLIDLTWLTCQSWQVALASDRMGVRLEGTAHPLNRGEMVSQPVFPGAIQWTNTGKPIILGVDGQTIGGYPVVAQVIDADLDLLAIRSTKSISKICPSILG